MSQAESAEGFRFTAPVVIRYLVTALIQAFLIVCEVAVLYPPLSGAGHGLRVGLLVGLGTLQFVVAVALFMHLWHEPLYYTCIFASGLLLAVGISAVLYAVIPRPKHPLRDNPAKVHVLGSGAQSMAPVDMARRLTMM